ncbi:hypothetical protein V6R21_02025 [Limibacter armeniacum]|uniref:hypothetical protein n=1 Tax=Limibacter armeniacum TaxID=466084 RepID=UPI002FE523A4
MATLYKYIIALCLLIFSNSLITKAQVADRPDKDRPTEVEVTLIILDIDEISDADQSFVANFFSIATWKDPRLAHDKGDLIKMPLDSIWHPTFQLVNQQKVWRTFSEVATVTQDGTVMLRQRVWGNFSQPLALQDFPLDIQTFTISIVSVGNQKEDVKIKVNPQSSVTRKPSVAGWKILSDTVDFTPVRLTEEVQTALTLNQRFKAKRSIGFYVYNVILPLVMIVIMSWIVFWIPPSDLGTRVGISITSMLTVIAYRFMVHSSLPTISYLTRIDYLINEATIIIFCTLLINLIANLMWKKKQESYKNGVDLIARILFPLMLTGILVKFFSV